MKHKTARGREFNMQAFSSGRGKTVAVGNSDLNAQGDLLGANKKIIATSQEIANKAHDLKAATKATTVSLNPAEKEISRKEVIGADGIPREEVAYADGSVEILPIEEKETKGKKKKTDDPLTGGF
jgi:hypothetical protein